MSGIALDVFSDVVLRPAWWLGKNLVYYVFYGSYYLIAGKSKTPEEKQEEHLDKVERKIDNLMEIIQALEPEKVQKIKDIQELRELGFETISDLTPEELLEMEEQKKERRMN